MHFFLTAPDEGARLLGLELMKRLQEGKRVLWLISGGSNIPLEARIMESLPDELTTHLTIIPIDERYGSAGHPDSNVQRLFDAGFLSKYATFYAPLDGSPLEITAANYARAVQSAFDGATCVIAQMGMGADGHVAGILPGSPAIADPALVTAYQGPDYMRLTLTMAALRRIDEAYLFAYGAEKRAALDKLRGGDVTIEEQPAQILREIGEVYVYNDQLEE